MDDLIIYNTDDGQTKVSLYANDGTVWMTLAEIVDLFQTSRPSIVGHINNIWAEFELTPEATCRKFRQVRLEGRREVSREIPFYSLDMILAIGFRVRSPRGVQFRRWANSSLREYLQKGFLLDDERLKNPDGRPDYFDELLARIRDIRASEKRFYQKLRDLFALSSDYDRTDKATQAFFAETQNKLIYGVTGQTAAELIMARADASKPNMALTSWAGQIVRRGDVSIAKNYLTHAEIDSLNRLVAIFLESAEFRVKKRKDLTLSFWRGAVDQLLRNHDVSVLQSAGRVSHDAMAAHVSRVYEEFDARRKAADARKADEDDMRMLEQSVKNIRHK